jgi:hypothetical protein
MKRTASAVAASTRPTKKSTAPFSGLWANALNQYCINPEAHKDIVVSFDEKVVVIRDQYPKVLLIHNFYNFRLNIIFSSCQESSRRRELTG